MQLMGGEGTPQKPTWSALEQMLASGDVSKIEVNNDKVAHIWLKKEVLEEYRQKPTYKTLPDAKHQFIYNIGNPDIFRSDTPRACGANCSVGCLWYSLWC